jgi:hypothetical protein
MHRLRPARLRVSLALCRQCECACVYVHVRSCVSQTIHDIYDVSRSYDD